MTDYRLRVKGEGLRFVPLRLTGIAAKRMLVEANLRLVVSLAKLYVDRGKSLVELIQAGNLGLITAVELFDSKGTDFTAYTKWCMRLTMARAIALT